MPRALPRTDGKHVYHARKQTSAFPNKVLYKCLPFTAAMFSSHVFHPGSQDKMQQQAVAEEARVQELRYEILLQVTTVKGEPYFIKHVEEARALKEGSITIVLSPGRTEYCPLSP